MGVDMSANHVPGPRSHFSEVAWHNNQEAEGICSPFPIAGVKYVMSLRRGKLWATLLFTDLVASGARP